MASETSHYLANKQIDNNLRGIQFTTPGIVYLALNTSNPTRAGNDTEVTVGNGYARVAVEFDTGVDGDTENSNLETWTASGAAFGTITHTSVWDAASSGNMLYSTPLDTPKVVGDGDTANFPAGDFDVSH